ncbi:hypothetical protein ACF3M1_08230 [Luteimonas sp. WGS1318]|uniref:hypothetical protein n=1 Tax=Luteimonas sp. WGS1318 TaxID=3366815 RepID=UPI00372CF4DB
MPKLSRIELDNELNSLGAWVPAMLAETDEHCHMDTFAGHADEIEARTAHEDQDHYWSRLQCILRDKGMVPRADEPCSE